MGYRFCSHPADLKTLILMSGSALHFLGDINMIVSNSSWIDAVCGQ